MTPTPTTFEQKQAAARSEALARELWKFSHLKMLGVVDDRATLRRWIASQNFPEPLILSGNSVAWIAAEVRAWLATRPRGKAPQPVRAHGEAA
jgi:predicted DNA-binding transcriptional regulator AlpA